VTRRTRGVAATSALVALAALLTPVTGAVAAPTSGQGPAPAASTPSQRPARPVTRLIVRMADGTATTSQVRTAAASLAGVRSASVVRRTSTGATLVGLSSAVSADEAWRVARALSARSDVAYAEPDLWVYPTSTAPNAPTDPLYATRQWDLWDSASATGGFATHATAVWSRTRGKASVVVAVIDTGLTAHEDLAASVTSPAATDPIVAGYDFVSDSRIANDGTGRDSNPSDPGDWITAAESQSGFFQDCAVDPSSWHGTHVTGTIVARSSNGIGVSGIAPGVKVQPVRALGKCGGDISDINDAIEWASGGTVAGVPANATPASVINLSLGGPGACLQSTQDAIDHARSRGTTVVVAAGNSGVSIAPSSPTSTSTGSQPADCSGVVSVSAIDRAGRLASYSNYGTPAFPVTIAAPGGDAVAGGNNIWSTINSGTQGPASSTYAPYAGTSMAAPHVAAAVALLQSMAVGRTAYTPDQAAALLVSLKQDFPTKAFKGGACTSAVCGAGILDLAGVLPTFAPLAPTVHGVVQPGAVALSWTPGDSGGLPVTYTVEQSEDGTSFHPTSPATTGISTTSATVTGLTDPLAQYWFRVVATNTDGPSAPSALAGPFRTAPYAVQAVAVRGGVEHLAVTWRPALAVDVTSYVVRFRRVGATSWIYRSVAATATSASATTWPTAMPSGTYQVQMGASHPGATVPGEWSTTVTASVTALRQGAVASSTVLRPYVDGVQDSIRFVATSNVRTTGVVRIVTSRGVLVRTFTLARGSRWTTTWTGRDSHGRLVRGGTYRADVRLVGRSGVATRVALRTFYVVLGRA
jgi:serine protease